MRNCLDWMLVDPKLSLSQYNSRLDQQLHALSNGWKVVFLWRVTFIWPISYELHIQWLITFWLSRQAVWVMTFNGTVADVALLCPLPWPLQAKTCVGITPPRQLMFNFSSPLPEFGNDGGNLKIHLDVKQLNLVLKLWLRARVCKPCSTCHFQSAFTVWRDVTQAADCVHLPQTNHCLRRCLEDTCRNLALPV